MRFRKLTAAVAIIITSAGLAACSTNVGVAATVQGHKITDSEVQNYLTPTAQAVSQQDRATGTTTSIPVRSFVLNTMITSRLLTTIVSRLPQPPSEAAISAGVDAQAGSTPAARQKFVKQVGVVGYTAGFDELVSRVVVINGVLSSLQRQNPAEFQKLLTNLNFPVSVNPRYGSWDAKTLSLDTSDGAGLPSFISIAPATNAATPGQPSVVPGS